MAHARLRLRACRGAAALLPRDALVGRAARPGEPALRVAAARARSTSRRCCPRTAPSCKALTLPAVYGISNARRWASRSFCGASTRALDAGLALVQVREKAPAAATSSSALPPRRSRLRARAARGCCVNGDPELARRAGRRRRAPHRRAADGSSTRARRCELVGASCHDARELERAAALPADFVVLGRCWPRPAIPGAATLGWERFAELIRDYPLPVYALGGLAARRSRDRVGRGRARHQHDARRVELTRMRTRLFFHRARKRTQPATILCTFLPEANACPSSNTKACRTSLHRRRHLPDAGRRRAGIDARARRHSDFPARIPHADAFSPVHGSRHRPGRARRGLDRRTG